MRPSRKRHAWNCCKLACLSTLKLWFRCDSVVDVVLVDVVLVDVVLVERIVASSNGHVKMEFGSTWTVLLALNGDCQPWTREMVDLVMS